MRSIEIHTSHHTHNVIGTGSGDPQKFDPAASRETLDHSLPYIFAVALEDGTWDHEESYAPARAGRPETIELWRKVSTQEDPAWTGRYLSGEAFGGRAVFTFADGTVLEDEIAVADAHPLGARPFGTNGVHRQVPPAGRRGHDRGRAGALPLAGPAPAHLVARKRYESST